MTLPDEAYRALCGGRKLAEWLFHNTGRIGRLEARKKAYWMVLRHWPAPHQMDRVREAIIGKEADRATANPPQA